MYPLTQINSIEDFIKPRIITFIASGMVLKNIQVRGKLPPKNSAECLNPFHFVLMIYYNIQIVMYYISEK